MTNIRHIKEHGHTNYVNNPVGNPKDRFGRARALGYRSGLEVETARYLEERGYQYHYEKLKIEWEDHAYRWFTPDFVLDNGIIIETKGLFSAEDRRKHIEVKRQHPHLDIRFVFSNASAKLYKGSKTTYRQWCEQQGFLWAHRVIPLTWLEETPKGVHVGKIELSNKLKRKESK